MELKKPQFGQKGRKTKEEIFSSNDAILESQKKKPVPGKVKKGSVEVHDPLKAGFHQEEVGEEVFLPSGVINQKIDDGQYIKVFLPEDKTQEKEDLAAEKDIETKIEGEKIIEEKTREDEKKKQGAEELAREMDARTQARREKAVDDFANDLLARINPEYFNGKLLGGDADNQIGDLRRRIKVIRNHKVDATDPEAFASLEEKKGKLEESKAEIQTLLKNLVDKAREEYVQKEAGIMDGWNNLKNSPIGRFISGDKSKNYDLDFLQKRYEDMANNLTILQSMDQNDKYDINFTNVHEKKIRASGPAEAMDQAIKDERINRYVAEADAGMRPYGEYQEKKEPKKRRSVEGNFLTRPVRRVILGAKEAASNKREELAKKYTLDDDRSRHYMEEARGAGRGRNTAPVSRGIRFGEDARNEIKRIDEITLLAQRKLAEIDGKLRLAEEKMGTVKTYSKEEKENRQRLFRQKLILEEEIKDLNLNREIVYIRRIRKHISEGNITEWNEVKDLPARELIFDEKGNQNNKSKLADVYRLIDLKLFPLVEKEGGRQTENSKITFITNKVLGWKKEELDKEGKPVDPKKHTYIITMEDFEPEEGETANAWIVRVIRQMRDTGQELFQQEKSEREKIKNKYEIEEESKRQRRQLVQEWQLRSTIDDISEENQDQLLTMMESEDEGEKINEFLMKCAIKTEGVNEYKELTEGKLVKKKVKTKDKDGKEKEEEKEELVRATKDEIKEFFRKKGVRFGEYSVPYAKEIARKMKKINAIGFAGLEKNKKLKLIANNIPELILDSVSENIMKRMTEEDRKYLLQMINNNVSFNDINRFLAEKLAKVPGQPYEIESETGRRDSFVKQNFVVFLSSMEKKVRWEPENGDTDDEKSNGSNKEKTAESGESSSSSSQDSSGGGEDEGSSYDDSSSDD